MTRTVSRPVRRGGRVFRGWLIAAAGAVSFAMVAGLLLQSYGNYFVALQAEFAWSATALSAAYAMVRLEAGLLGPLQGWLIDRYGPRANMRVGMSMLGIGFLLFSQVRSLLHFYVAFGVMAIGAAFAGIMPISVAVVSWFNRWRSRALSVVLSGVSAGGLLVPAVAVAMERFGWRTTAVASACVFLSAGLAITRLFDHRPEDVGETVDGLPPAVPTAAAGGDPPGEASDYTARQAVRTVAFWAISAGHASAVFLVATVLVHLVPHLHETLGYPLTRASLALMFLSLMHFGGIVLGGIVGDRLPKRSVVVTCGLMHATALVLLATAASWPAVVAFAVLHGSAWGIRGPLMQAIRADYFGRGSYGTIFGLSSMLVMAGAMAGPLVTGLLHDHLGSYRPALAMVAVAGLLCSGFFALARPPGTVRRSSAALPTSG